MIRLMISQSAISKSMDGNLKSRLKKRGILISLRRDEGVVEPKLEGPPVGRGREMCGFMMAWWSGEVMRRRTLVVGWGRCLVSHGMSGITECRR